MVVTARLSLMLVCAIGFSLTLVSPASAAATPPDACSAQKWTSFGQPPPTGSLPDCPNPDSNAGKYAPKNPAPPLAPPPASGPPKAKQAPAQEPAKPKYRPAFDGEEPTMAPDQWGKRLAEGVQGLGSEFNRLLGKGFGVPKFGTGFVTLYSLMFGLGLLLAAFATTLATKDIARKGVTARETAIHAYTRLLVYLPVMAVVPFAMSMLNDIATGLSSGFLEYGRKELSASIAWVVTTLGTATLVAPVFPGGMAVLIGVCLFLIGSLFAILIELAIAQYLVYILALLIPIIFAASINPRWHGGVKKLTGGLIGAMLTPAALSLTWAVFASTLNGGGITDDGKLKRAVLIGAALLASVAAPFIIGIVLSYIVPAFADWHDGDRQRGRYAMMAAAVSARGGSRRLNAGADQAKAARLAKGQNASSGAKTQMPVDSAAAAGGGGGGAAAGGGSAAGAAGLGAAIFAAIMKATKSGADHARDSAGRSARNQSNNHQGDAPRPGSGGDGERPDRSSGGDSSSQRRPAGDTGVRRPAPDTSSANGPGRDGREPFSSRQRDSASHGSGNHGKDRPR